MNFNAEFQTLMTVYFVQLDMFLIFPKLLIEEVMQLKGYRIRGVIFNELL